MTTYHLLAETLKLGIIQTSLDHQAAWVSSAKMEPAEEERAITEIRSFFATFRQEPSPPDIILLPELAVPSGFELPLRRMAEKLGSVVIAGFDYCNGEAVGTVRNEALVIVPKRWRGQVMGSKTMVRHVGKTFAAPEEAKKLEAIHLGFESDTSVWLFDGDDVGRFGVAVCYDFMDLERIAMYRGNIQHLFILAYNKDATSFQHVAEAVSRMSFCNVVVCNCGHFGGSLAVSPYRFAERRKIYQHAGARLATAQVISLPVKRIAAHQQGDPPLVGTTKEFKSLPPGYTHAVSLTAMSAPLAAAEP